MQRQNFGLNERKSKTNRKKKTLILIYRVKKYKSTGKDGVSIS